MVTNLANRKPLPIFSVSFNHTCSSFTNIVPSQLVKIFPLHLPIFYPPNFSYTVAYITDCCHCAHNRWCHYHTSYSIVTWDNRLKCYALWYNWEWSLTPCNCYWLCSSTLMSPTGWLTSLCHTRFNAWCIGPVCPLGFQCPLWFSLCDNSQSFFTIIGLLLEGVLVFTKCFISV